MGKVVHCNGGPWHDKQVELLEDADHFHIVEPVEEAIKRALAESNPELGGFQRLPVREGTYSQVGGRTGQIVPGEFEWDGWVSHD